ncbi:hypothetical protein SAY86_015009 [Trapa natans]|uniref:Prefoldin subunit 3 n=1 Tax=Trapa natans TaxID=22666 RepID=A0AAN7KH19_TRANT|nr:hypothetical protein SAY86_015009 [Trapa natans]
MEASPSASLPVDTVRRGIPGAHFWKRSKLISPNPASTSVPPSPSAKNEGMYSRSRVEGNDSVCLWLGANVMLEYSCEEATDLLQKNLQNAKVSLEVLTDLQFLRDQVTIIQVTIARVYNWDVHRRRIRSAASASTDS